MTEKLNVLVLESERGAADWATEELVAAGHAVLRCHEHGSPAFPCQGLLEGGECPLDAADIDVAVTVRPRPRSQPAPQEDGIACALRRHVPLVVAGNPTLNPYSDYATFEIDAADDLVAACRRAADEPLRPHTQAAARAARQTLDLRGNSSAPIVSVRRTHGGLAVDVMHAVPYDRATKSMMSVRICAALRAVDHDARGIDVAFRAT